MTEASANILLVDDDRQTRLKLTRNLQACGHIVSAVEGGQAALDRLSAETFDVILLDILMPDMDGFEVLRALGAEASLSEIPVIVISAMADAASKEKSMQLGAQAFLSKPVDAEALNAQVAQCLEQGK
jgi:adenylate cyclase